MTPEKSEVVHKDHSKSPEQKRETSLAEGPAATPRKDEQKPEQRYGADDLLPNRGSQSDGSEYDWRGDQAGRGGQQDYWRGEGRDDEEPNEKDKAPNAEKANQP